METTTNDLRKDVNAALNDLEQIADEVRVKIHLAEMAARTLWQSKLEPQLFEARTHAKQATLASKAAIEETARTIRDFAKGL